MKMKSIVQTSASGLKQLFALGALLMLLVVPHTARGASAAELLEKGIYTEETKGALTAATEIYRQIVEDAGADRSLVALWEAHRELQPRRRVYIWSLDQHLAGYDTQMR